MAVVEYNVETRTTQDPLTEADLTTLGASEWELISVIQDDLHLTYIFKK